MQHRGSSDPNRSRTPYKFTRQFSATYTYDSLNNLASETHPVDSTHNATTSYTYNSFGEPLTITDALGHITTNTYDTHGNLTSVTTPALHSASVRLNSFARPKFISAVRTKLT